MLFFSLGIVHAENVEHEDILCLSFGGNYSQDQYLSPLFYKGLTAGIANEWWQPFTCKDSLSISQISRWKHVGMIDFTFAWMYNPAHANRLMTLTSETGWGAHYYFIFPHKGIRLLIGPYLNLQYTPKYLARHVNKPYSMDVALDMDAMMGVQYVFSGKHTSYRLQYLLLANMVGVDYLQDYWQSYYEMSEGVLGKFRCSGMWNHRYLSHSLSLDMQFAHSTWRIGIRHRFLEYGESGMMYSNECVSATLGCIFRYRIRPNHNLLVL